MAVADAALEAGVEQTAPAVAQVPAVPASRLHHESAPSPEPTLPPESVGKLPQDPSVDEQNGSSSEGEPFDYEGLAKAQLIAGQQAGQRKTAVTPEPREKRKPRGWNKESARLRKQRKREDDLSRVKKARQAGAQFPSLEEMLKAVEAREKKAPPERQPANYADAVNTGTGGASASSSAPAAALGQVQQDSNLQASVRRLTKDTERRTRVAEVQSARKVFVTNLPFDATEEHLRARLGVCGTIKEVHLARHKVTAKPLGYAHVQFETVSAVEAAIQQCDKFELNKRIVRVTSIKRGEKFQFELPEELKSDIKALMKEKYEGMNLSAIKDAWEKRHPGEKLDIRRFGFKNFSSAVKTIEGVAVELHLEKHLTNLAFFEESPAHLAYKEQKRLKQEEAASGQSKKRPDPPQEDATSAPETKRRRVDGRCWDCVIS